MVNNIIKKKGAFYKPPFFISYLITDPSIYGSTVKLFKKNLQQALKNNSVDMVCFRDKETKDIKPLAKVCLEVSRQFNIQRVVLNSNINLAIELGFDGVHLRSDQFEYIDLTKQHNLYTIISCHNEKDVAQAKELGSDAVTYSPIFYKEHKGEPKGLENLKTMVSLYQDSSFHIIALGGIISLEHIRGILSTKSTGFASIRYFFI